MTLEKSFAREIQAVNGNGSREARVAFLNRAREAARAMSSPEIMGRFDEFVHRFGRDVVGICVAATICCDREGRIPRRMVDWAKAVMSLWTNRPGNPSSVLILDNLHPCRIGEYAGTLIRETIDAE